MHVLQSKPYALERDQEGRLEAWNADMLLKANAEQTGGVLNLLELPGPSGFATPLHAHVAETWKCTFWKAR